MNLDEIRGAEARYLMQTYKRGPVCFVRGEGAYLWDDEGERYLDFLSGISVCSVGHCHPDVVAAVREQAGELTHVSNLFYSEPMVGLAKRLSECSLGGRVFLANSGTEANECAIKLARKHARERGVGDPEIVSFERDFHGRTYGALSATPGLAANPDFAPMLPGFRSVPFDDAGALREAVGESTAAIFLEPIQGESGVYPLSEGTLTAAREACDETGALLVLDEIQTGMGRTGSLWAWEQTPVRPDVMTAAKALGGGLPVGACVAAPEVSEVLGAGDHGSTFAGGAVAARAALAALEVIDEPGLLREVRAHGADLSRRLLELDGVEEVRGRGLMLGVGLAEGIDAAEVATRALEERLVVNAPEPRTIRLLPPLVIGAEEVGLAIERLSRALGG
ncbi:MAG TPA: acetylornithine/succinylornithine family transaminase [Solirubrobacterales bacterium]|nr:acetylornithine/succinylornithine family transaminase [Solirubrobacterales bacterium]